MPVTSNEVGFAITLQNDPTTLRPNRETIPFELRDSGLLRNQGLPRPFVNELFYRQGQAILTVQSEYQAADTTLQDNIDTVVNDLAQEVTDRENADANLQSQIDALTQSILQTVYPVGKYYFSEDSTSPATVLGFGTWARVEGRFIVGLDASDTAFDTAGEQGGFKEHSHTASTTTNTTTNTTVNDHALTTAEMPSHAHRLYGTDTSSASVEPLNGATVAGDTNGGGAYTNSGLGGNQLVEDTGNGDGHNHTASSTSTSTSSTTVDNATSLPPYEVAYIWKRTA